MGKKVIVYTAPTCPHCTLTKVFLTDRGVEFVEKNVAVDPKAADEMIQKSGQMGVPVIDVDGEMIVGFDREAIKKALGMV